MKYLKEFENYWTTDTTGNFNITYGDKIEDDSDIVNNVKNYINDNLDNIKEVTDETVYFNRDNDVLAISLDSYESQNKYFIRFLFNSRNKNIEISEDELNDLIKFFKNTYIKMIKKNRKQNIEDVLDEINPLRRDAKKYGL